MNHIYPTEWHAQPAWALEDEAVRVVIVPSLGAKIVSLFDKRHSFEWLVGPQRPLKPVIYGSSFIAQDMSGWDEMFPTINACDYPIPGDYAGQFLPDHGEVWSLPWQVESHDDNASVLRVDGVALPYRLTRRATLLSPGVILLEYRLENTGSASFAWLWAAHPQFVAGEHTAIVLPESATQVVNVIQGEVWGAAGERYPWPHPRSKDGRSWELERVRPADSHDCRKFYLPPESPVSLAAVVNRHLGCSLRMEWSPEELPYLGIWVDEGTYNPQPVVALEPSNGYYDSLQAAVANQRVGRIQPGGRQSWSLVVRMGS
jgi:galactose mutarotase-like enzyme